MASIKSSDAKRRVIVDYKNVTNEILDLFTDRYPYGYDERDIIRFNNSKGETIKAVPFETSETKYLVKISQEMDQQIEAYLEEDNDTELTNDAKDQEIPEVASDDMDD